MNIDASKVKISLPVAPLKEGGGCQRGPLLMLQTWWALNEESEIAKSFYHGDFPIVKKNQTTY